MKVRVVAFGPEMSLVDISSLAPEPIWSPEQCQLMGGHFWEIDRCCSAKVWTFVEVCTECGEHHETRLPHLT